MVPTGSQVVGFKVWGFFSLNDSLETMVQLMHMDLMHIDVFYFKEVLVLN